LSDTYDIFRIPVFAEYTDLDNKAMSDYSLSLMKKDEGRKLSNEGGWQSKDLTGVHMPLNDLFKNITTASNNFASQLFLPKQRISNIWININGYKDFNTSHRHPNSFLSGVYYLQTHENCGCISMTNPCASLIEGYWSPHLIVANENRLNCKWEFPAETGRMFIFPSWMEHEVKPNLDKDKKRISISWNTCVDKGE
tara:strand:+ start:3196 stop:3783 length:588 start_codon:yes stop_codon:yes gene_type:complete